MLSVLASASVGREPPVIIMLPFALLLLAIALAPLLLQHHWERHAHRVSFFLAAGVCGYYVFARNDLSRVAEMLGEYITFIIVVGAFFVVSSGTHLRARAHATPLASTIFLLAGAGIANLVGTVGASLLLIRPWIEMNKPRLSGWHIAFFIFTVSNVGGALLPIGPPLFLGYLTGVPFLWPLVKLWPHLLLTTALLLLIFYVGDSRLWRRIRVEPVAGAETWHLFGKRNFIFMAVLLVALIALPPVWREAVMLASAVASFRLTPAHVYTANAFTLAPIKEVGWIFFGIFGTMIPVLDYVQLHAPDLTLRSPIQFFWATGVLSALLDNAPTYLTFLAAAVGLHNLNIDSPNEFTQFVSQHDAFLVAVSLGASLFGALTYIGNGPNLLVKAIAENVGVPVPSFFGFIFKYSAPILLPLFALLSILFLRQ